MTVIRLSACLVGLLLTVGAAADARIPGRIADLAWMTGSWAGPVGPGQTLEEHWIEPTGGSIAALVRSTRNGATGMVELIVVEEEDDTLVLRVQQWDPGFRPRTPAAQTMVLAELGDRSVRFQGTDDAPIRSLAYSRPTPEAFHIDIETATGQTFQIKLTAR